MSELGKVRQTSREQIMQEPIGQRKKLCTRWAMGSKSQQTRELCDTVTFRNINLPIVMRMENRLKDEKWK